MHGAVGDTTVVGQAFDRDGNTVDHGGFTPAFNGSGTAMSSPSLVAGYNRVSMTVQGGNAFTLLESTNCVEIAYLKLRSGYLARDFVTNGCDGEVIITSCPSSPAMNTNRRKNRETGPHGFAYQSRGRSLFGAK